METRRTADPALTGQEDIAAYDANRAGAENQLVAMYETDAQARAARDQLVAAGIAEGSIHLVDARAEAATTGSARTSSGLENEGLWGSMKRFFMPDEDAYAYTEGVRRGHAMLVVRPRPEQQERAIQILEQSGPLDFDARMEEWRASGWQSPGIGAATVATTPTPTAPVAERRGVDMASGKDEVIPIVEEQVRVGKRVVGGGTVRVRSYVVERPVEEQVTLREERIEVERHPVDRAAGTLPEDAFRERTIEVSATSEEAVVSKEARVVEEVGVRKEATERTETVRDTVRRTEVEVEDGRKTGLAGTETTRTATTTDPLGKTTPRR